MQQQKEQTNEEILKMIHEYKIEGLQVIISGIAIKMIIGIYYAWPILQTYHQIMISYEGLTQFEKFLLFFTFPIINIVMSICLPKGDKIMNQLGPKYTVLILSCIISLTFSVIGYMKNNLYLHFILLTCIVAPSLGCLYQIPFLCSWKYFPKQRTSLNSIFQLFSGIGAALAIFLFQIKGNQTALSLYFDEGEEFCAHCNLPIIRESFGYLGQSVLFLGAIASTMITVPDDKHVETMIDYDLLAFNHEEIPQFSQEIDAIDKEVQTIQSAIRGQHFQYIVLILLTTSFLSYIFLAQFQTYTKIFGIHSSLSVNIFQITIICYGLQRYLVSNFEQRISFKKFMISVLFAKIFLLSLFLLSLRFNFQIIGVISISGLVILLGTIYSALTLYIPQIFGSNIASTIFSVILILFAISNLTAQILAYSFFNSQIQMLKFYGVIILFFQIWILIRIKKL